MAGAFPGDQAASCAGGTRIKSSASYLGSKSEVLASPRLSARKMILTVIVQHLARWIHVWGVDPG